MKNNLSLWTFTEPIIAEMENAGKTRTAETYTCMLRSVRRFCGGEDVPLRAIDAAFVESYERWMAARGISRNSSSFYIRILRAVYNRAADSRLVADTRPFRHVYTGVDKTAKRAVPLSVIRRLKTLDFGERKDLDLARDIFMFSFYTRGMSFVDMAYLKRSNLCGKVLTYARSKTGQKIVVHWENCMQEIVDKYPENPTGHLLPIIVDPLRPERRQYKNAIFRINASPHEISGMLHLTAPLTTYVARHSWASIAYAQNIPLPVISEGMGHDSERTTRIYLSSISNSRVDRANNKIINLINPRDDF